MENYKAPSEKTGDRDEGKTQRHERKPASAQEAGGNYGDAVTEQERDQLQKNYKPKETTGKPGIEVRRGRTERYNEKTASENQGR